jgi:DMSO/TMAO reductase YedYZ molybdopterin-dependent catalytic subunit
MLAAMAATGAASLVDPEILSARAIDRILMQVQCDADPPVGERIATLPLGRAGWARQPFGVKFGGPGLDARLITDLSELRADRLITPTDRVYVRTECPAAVAAREAAWTIAISDATAGASTASLSIADLLRRARPMGTHLLECAGNNNPTNFGLMSVAEWDGVPLAEIVERRDSSGRQSSGVLVTGIDHDGQISKTSTAGASWILPLDAIDRLGAFLAVRMNGDALPLDHGRPVRLVVPRWYGCAWIKWVSEIRLVGPDEPATSQMREFAGRTHQTRRHDLARDYTAPEIETAAMPIRVDKCRGPAGLTYLITGIVWGGTRAIERLEIRCGSHESWSPLAVCPAPATAAIWSLWTWRWRPNRPGLYEIALRIPDRSIPQRRLDANYYHREVQIEEV